MNGPTMRRCADGSARRTEKPPRSLVRGTITRSIASHAWASPGRGSLPGKKLMVESPGGATLTARCLLMQTGVVVYMGIGPDDCETPRLPRCGLRSLRYRGAAPPLPARAGEVRDHLECRGERVRRGVERRRHRMDRNGARAELDCRDHLRAARLARHRARRSRRARTAAACGRRSGVCGFRPVGDVPALFRGEPSLRVLLPGA